VGRQVPSQRLEGVGLAGPYDGDGLKQVVALPRSAQHLT
jgi:hypothetical protein